jgi:two-component system KDP operon response regulator KdpE
MRLADLRSQGHDDVVWTATCRRREGGPVRVLLATDRRDLGDALCLFLSERHVDIVGVAGDRDLLLDLAASAHPDVVVVDWHLAGGDSAATVADIRRSDHPGVVILGTSRERRRALAARADAYATVGDPPEALLAVLREVMHATA